MITNRTKEEIYHMLSYVLNPEDLKDTDLVAHWTDVLFELHTIRQKFPRPTSALLEIKNEVHAFRKMRVDALGLKIDSNHQQKWLDNNSPDIKVYGDVVIESSDKDLTIIGNVNGNIINIKGDLKTDTLCNVGDLYVTCNKLEIDTFRISGNIRIMAKEISCSDFVSDKTSIIGNVKTTFFNSNKTKIEGNVEAIAINGTSDENFNVDLNKN